MIVSMTFSLYFKKNTFIIKNKPTGRFLFVLMKKSKVEGIVKDDKHTKRG
ncbi:hypothetical protein BPUM_0473 [Bacillus pumilus SAFR-032]|uniref:Uncharacterized protein n=1 Tax=Bacillus pumilus (strain SAFR-032) TaxID=315750 RepID=A8FAA1_BACP2|nr:hypothetical protein BPUM_0473 [Bacillus pumilus SAFR-032]